MFIPGNLKSRLNFESRPMRLLACMIILICMIAGGKSLWAWAAESATIPDKGKLSEVADGQPTLTFGKEGEPDELKFRVPEHVPVEINGSPAELSELRYGDEITVGKDADGKIVKLTARRLTAGMIVDTTPDAVIVSADLVKNETYPLQPGAKILVNGNATDLKALQKGSDVNLVLSKDKRVMELDATKFDLLSKFWNNFKSNLFKPLLLFFYVGFCIPLLRVAFDFPKPIYQGLTIYLLISIGWHGGEELAVLSSDAVQQALSFMVVGFLTNTVIAIAAYGMLRTFVPKLRKIDAATVSAYYGSDSAGTFVTCMGVLQAAHIASAAYMPVMLAIMEIPGCLVGLLLVMRLRKTGMDALGNMPNEPNYNPEATGEDGDIPVRSKSWGHVLHEIFFNAGSFLLFGGIFIGYVARLQGVKVVQQDDALFISLFQGFLCLFLLEMGMTAARRLQDLRSVNWTYIAFGLVAPNIFAVFGLSVAQLLSHALHQPFQLGTYTLFAVLCAAASYIAVPAVQRLAIPEASPSLPLAASLGLTFSYNVTIGIPLYMMIAQMMMRNFPVE